MRLRPALLLTLAAAALPGRAQMPSTELMPSLAVGCLGPAEVERVGPEYPFEAWKSNHGGRVTVVLRFSAPDAAPRVEVQDSEGEPAFVEAIRAHAQRLRVPCLEAGTEARLRRVYVFNPALRTAEASEPVDAGALLRSELLKCLRHPKGDKQPDYPFHALQAGVQGRVHAVLHFTDPASGPSVKLFSRPDAKRWLEPGVQEWTRELRLPCLTGESVRASMAFVYRIEGTSAYGFRALTLRELLPMVKDIRQRELKLDTRAMNCPLDVRWTYLRPDLPNHVALSDAPTAANLPLRAFLAAVELELPRKLLDAVYADTTLVTIPCININLQPQPKESSK